MLSRKQLAHLIDVGAGRKPADIVFKNGRVVNVYTGTIDHQDVAVAEGRVAGIGDGYEGKEQVNLEGKYLVPGLIDAHIHVESSYVSPEEFSRLFVPCGTTTVIADPHEIVNVSGMTGLNYMIEAAKLAPLDIRYMMPPCVPSTKFEHAGAQIGAQEIQDALSAGKVDGLAELMNYVGVINNDPQMLDEILAANKYKARIDGHAPELMGKDLNAYIAAGANNDHECSTVEEARQRLSRGMYVLLRQGTTEHNLETLLPVVTSQNSRRCLLCGDDVQAKTAISVGHLDSDIRICISHGLSPITAIRMATLNAAEYCRLYDRGGIAPSKRADLLVVDNLRQFNVQQVYIKGKLVAENGHYLPAVKRYPIDSVTNSVHVKDFNSEKLRMHLTGKPVRVIEALSGQVLTGEKILHVQSDSLGNFKYNPTKDVTKIAVVERHHLTGNVGLGLITGYGIKHGAIAISIGHDSHNLMTTGISDEAMTAAIQALIKQQGGVVEVDDNGHVIGRLPLPIGGLMSDAPAEKVVSQLKHVDEVAHRDLGIPKSMDPVMTLSFLPLAVIPKLKITDEGLFDVAASKLVPLEVD